MTEELVGTLSEVDEGSSVTDDTDGCFVVDVSDGGNSVGDGVVVVDTDGRSVEVVAGAAVVVVDSAGESEGLAVGMDTSVGAIVGVAGSDKSSVAHGQV